jgi:hypothetical protein
MDNPEDILTNKTFFSYVFNFDTETKNSLFNLTQYLLLAVIPVVLLNKSVQYVFPEPDETATTLTHLGEIAGQLVYIFIMLVFINRIITYIPTYSQIAYGDISLLSVVLPFLVIILSLQTKVGQKVGILVERAKKAYSGKTEVVEQDDSSSSQPLPTHQASRADYVTTNQGSAGIQGGGAEGVYTAQMRKDSAPSRTGPGGSPDFNAFYTNGPGTNFVEPMAGGQMNYAAF